MTADLPRLLARPHGSPLLTRAEVADLLGYSRRSMATVMSNAPDRWPAPAALLRSASGQWLMLWDGAEILAAAPPATATERRGSAATISDAEGLIPCNECGRRFRSLGRHLQAAHDLTAAEYRARHRLPATGALNCDGSRQSGSDYWRARLAGDPGALDHLTPYQAPERLGEMRQAAIEANRATRDYDAVREHRAPGQRYATQVMQSRRRDALHDKARRAGFDSLDDAVHQTAGLPARAAAERIGIGENTVRRHRKRLEGPPTSTGRDERTH